MRRQSNANSYLLLRKDAADGRAWAGLVSKWKAGLSLSLSHSDGETRASGCHAPVEMMLGVLSSRNGYVILETGNETRRSRPPLTECHSTVQAVDTCTGRFAPACVRRVCQTWRLRGAGAARRPARVDLAPSLDMVSVRLAISGMTSGSSIAPTARRQRRAAACRASGGHDVGGAGLP